MAGDAMGVGIFEKDKKPIVIRKWALQYEILCVLILFYYETFWSFAIAKFFACN